MSKSLDKCKTLSDFPQRTIFKGPTTAAAFSAAVDTINRILECANAENIDTIVYGVNAEGTIDPTLWPDPAQENGYHADICIAIQNVQRPTDDIGADGKVIKKQHPEAVLIWPTPTIEALLASPAGRKYLDSAMGTQFNGKLMAVIRGADDKTSQAVFDSIPVSIESYAASSRTGAKSARNATFKALWKPVAALLTAKSLAWKQSSLNKQQIIEGLQSKVWAETYHPQLEAAGLFTLFGNFLILLAGRSNTDTAESAEPTEYDTTLVDEYLAERDAKELEPLPTDEILDLDSLVASFDAAQAADDDDEETPDESDEMEDSDEVETVTAEPEADAVAEAEAVAAPQQAAPAA